MNKKWLTEAEEFRAKHGLACTAEEISETMSLAELGLLPQICPVCYAGEHFHCYGQGCECKVCKTEIT